MILFVLFACSFIKSAAQIRIEVVRHPEFSLSDSSIFISASFNGWSPGDEDFKLTRRSDGIYYFDLPDTLTYFEYKFTQGSWAFVEGSKDGKVMPNRVYNKALENTTSLVQVEITAWERQPSYAIIVKKIPKNTPFDASIYIMGDFNNWNAADRHYKLNKQVDGTFHTLVYSSGSEVQFKFTRGTLASVESRPGGRFLQNRIISRQKATDASRLEIDIAGWADLTDGTQLYSIYDLLLLFSFFQGLLLVITIPSIQGYNRSANRWLLFLIGFSSVILLLKVITNYPSISQTYPKLQILPDFIFFIYSPIFYFYINRLLFQSRNLWSTKVQFHFIPALAQFFIYMVYFLTDTSVFESKLAYQYSDLYMVRFFFGVIAVIINIYYWRVSLRTLNNYKEDYRNSNSYEQNLQYLNTVLFIQAICLFAGAFTLLIAVLGTWWGFDVFRIVEFSIETIWIVFSMITFFLGYFAIHEPDIFRVPEMFVESRDLSGLLLPTQPLLEPKHIQASKEKETIENLGTEVEKLAAYMDDFKPYINPKLTLVELASGLKQPPYILSRIINAGYDKNFFDFINGYRIDEFKRRIEDPKFRNYTLLSIAFDVGFNSKTAFNRSFKKITNETPSSYFNNRREY